MCKALPIGFLVLTLITQAVASAEPWPAHWPLLRQGETPPETAKIELVSVVTPDILEIIVQSGFVVPGRQEPLQPTDEVELAKGKKGARMARWVWQDGKAVMLDYKAVRRDGEHLGYLVESHELVTIASHVTPGSRIDYAKAAQPATYAISSNDDPSFSAPVTPTAVHIKLKPNGCASGKTVERCKIYLKLPQALTSGKTYHITLGLQTDRTELAWTFDPRSTRSEAVHANQVGYAPDDPYKRAYLSIWLGTGGAYEYARELLGEGFELIEDKTGRTVYRGTILQTKGKDDVEFLGATTSKQDGRKPISKDYARTAVYALDFSDFNTPGVYRALVPSLGTSFPFRIDVDVWIDAFRVSMQGILSQRNGIDLPDDALGGYVTGGSSFDSRTGQKFVQLTVAPNGTAERERNDNYVELIESGQLEKFGKPVWGGYKDAGDWDAHTHHLRVADYLTALYDYFPAYFKDLPLHLPSEERQNNIPDVLLQSAIRAFDWTCTQTDTPDKAAALDLYRATGHQKYLKSFNNHGIRYGQSVEYLLLPSDATDEKTRNGCLEQVENMSRICEVAIQNAYNQLIKGGSKAYHGYLSTPETGGNGLVRLYRLRPEKKYHVALLQSVNYCLGANPDNATYTTGLGSRYPHFGLHVDAMRTGQPEPPGLTIFGPYDPSMGYLFCWWVEGYTRTGRQMLPDFKTWPVHEVYPDIGVWAPVCEYTMHQTLAGMAQHLGMLSAISPGAKPGKWAIRQHKRIP